MNIFFAGTLSEVAAFSIFILLGNATPVEAQCSNSATPSCAVYTQCFSKYCPCDAGEQEYFQSYGLRYCQRFLENDKFSEQGKRWRDATLVCLQEKIVPRLDISATPQCNCEEMRSFAFASHVECYTQDEVSMCDLLVSDLNEIRKTVDTADAFSSEGWRQMAAVAKICSEEAPDDGRQAVWRTLAAILAIR